MFGPVRYVYPSHLSLYSRGNGLIIEARTTVQVLDCHLGQARLVHNGGIDLV